MITPSISYLFNLKKGALSIGLQAPFFIDGSFAGNEGNIDQEVSIPDGSLLSQILFQ